jgi:hypothetical protein
MGAVFGADFGDVRGHADGRVDASILHVRLAG